MDKPKCQLCGFENDSYDIVSDHVVVVHGMGNVLPLKPKEKSTHEKLVELLGNDQYLLFYPTPDNLLSWRNGKPMSVEKLTFVRAVLDKIIAHEMDTLMTSDIDG